MAIPADSNTSTTNIVILGAGYGGIVTAQRLQKLLRPGEASVTLINKHDYHYLTTHLHMPAAGTDSLESARIPIASLLDTPRTSFLKATVTRIDPEHRQVILEKSSVRYDILVVCLGGEPETFGIPGIAEYAMNIRSLNSARLIRERIEQSFANYQKVTSHSGHLTFVVGGAGFTGTEFVGELADRLHALSKQYDIDPQLIRLYNIEASPKALPPGLPPELVRYGMDVLQRKGVIFKLGTRILSCQPDGVQLNGGEFIQADAVIWAGGTRGNRLLEQSGFETTRGQVAVDLYLRSPQYDNVYVIGDSSLVIGLDGQRVPSSAQLAVQQAIHTARTISASLRGERTEPFVYAHKGTVASLGKGAGVGVIGRRLLKGRTAALMKRIVDSRYLFTIGGFPLVMRKWFYK